MTKYFIASHIEIIVNSSYSLGNMGELLTRGKHYKVQRDDRVVDGEGVQARGDEEEASCPRRGGEAAPVAERLSVVGDRFELDAVGNVVGGVRTPVVEASVEVLSGFAAPGASPICALFGRTLPLAASVLAARWESRAAYLAAYSAATDAAIEAGFVLAEDRPAVLAEARPDLLPG